MKSIDEFEKFYSAEMIPQLEELDARRKQILKKWYRTGLFTALAIPFTILIINSIWDIPAEFYVFSSFLVLIIGVIAGSFYASDKTFYSDFKKQVIERIVRFINPDLTYQPQNFISLNSFLRSRIFLTDIDRYRGDDLIQGKIDKTEIMFSEIKAEYKTTTTDSKGKTHETWHTIFKGMFFIADFNKHFKTSTVVLPNRLGKGFLADFFNSMNIARREKSVKLEDPDFSKHFVVYSDDQIEARYVLSTSLMRRITEFKEKHPNSIFLSFVNSYLHVAISYQRNLFEPRYLKKITDFSVAKSYFEDFQLALSIVDELNLNNRIWTKQ